MKIVFSIFLSLSVNAYGENNLLTCYPYPFAVKGAPAISGAKIATLRAFRFEKRHFIPAKIQIDEVNINGDYVLEDGLPFTAHTGDGIFNFRDEIVFDGTEFGEDFSIKDVSAKISSRAQWMKKLTFKNENSRCPNRLLLVQYPAETSMPHYDKLFDPLNQKVESPEFLYRFNPKSPILLGEVYLKAEDKNLSQVFTRSNFVMPLVSSRWYFPNLNFEAADFTSAIESWRNGPIRSIVAVGSKYQNFFSIVNLHLFSELIFYRNRFQIPTKIEFIFDTEDYLKLGSGLGYAIEFPKDKVWELETNLTPLPKNSLAAESAEVNPKKPAHFYAHGQRSEGEFWLSVDVDDRARSMVPPPYIIYKDMFQNPLYQKTLPWLSKNNGDLGFYLDIAGIKKGMYDFRLDLTLSRSNQEFKKRPLEVAPSLGPQQTQDFSAADAIVWETLQKDVISKSRDTKKEL